MKENKVRLDSPWIIYYNKLKAMFEEDPDIRMEFDKADYTIKMWVEDPEKAEALEQLLPAVKEFGSVVVKITVIPANKLGSTKVSLFQKAFKNNPAVAVIDTVNTPFGTHSFVIFEKKVVQYHNDDMFDFNGVCSTLYQDIAKDVFGEFNDIHFCTTVD